MMSKKIGTAGQIINFNFVHSFVAENLNKILYATFTPGVLNLTYNYINDDTEIEITELSALVQPKINQIFLFVSIQPNPLRCQIFPRPILI